jgi:hypothetical protein
MNLSQSIAFDRVILAGGQGSGRHAEYGDMHKMLLKRGYEHHPSGQQRQDYIHPDTRVHIQVNPKTGGWRRAEYPDHEGGHGASTLHDYLRGGKRMAAGGFGSGCHGPNCGRPKAAGGRVGIKFPHTVVHKIQVDPKTKHVYDVYTKNGKLTALIPRSEYPLTPAQREVERRFSRQIGSDPQKWIDEYKRKEIEAGRSGNSLNADDAKELSPDFRKDRSTNAAAVHEPASWLIKEMFKQELQKSPGGKRGVVFFTAGAAGTGKTSAIRDDPNAKAALESAQIVYDGTLRPASKAIARVSQALQAGKEAAVLYTYRDPATSFRSGMLRRASDMERDKGSGRVVTLNEMAAQHASVGESMQKLYATYKDNPKFTFGVINNSFEKGQGERTTLDKLPPAKSYDELKVLFTGILNEEYAKGNISSKIYRAVLGVEGNHKEIGM